MSHLNIAAVIGEVEAIELPDLDEGQAVLVLSTCGPSGPVTLRVGVAHRQTVQAIRAYLSVGDRIGVEGSVDPQAALGVHLAAERVQFLRLARRPDADPED